MERAVGSPAGGQVAKYLKNTFPKSNLLLICRESRDHCPTDSLSEASSEYESDWEAEVLFVVANIGFNIQR